MTDPMPEKIESKQCCEKCIFFKETYGQRGECRRYPPQAWSESHPETSSSLGFNFPEMRSDEWCGEFKGLEGWILPKGFEIPELKHGAGVCYEVKSING